MPAVLRPYWLPDPSRKKNRTLRVPAVAVAVYVPWPEIHLQDAFVGTAARTSPVDPPTAVDAFVTRVGAPSVRVSTFSIALVVRDAELDREPVRGELVRHDDEQVVRGVEGHRAVPAGEVLAVIEVPHAEPVHDPRPGRRRLRDEGLDEDLAASLRDVRGADDDRRHDPAVLPHLLAELLEGAVAEGRRELHREDLHGGHVSAASSSGGVPRTARGP